MIARFTASAIALALAATASGSGAAAGTCIGDDELETAVGDQIRAGAFAVNTAKLGDRPLCSGLTMAQAIQRLRQRLVPTAGQPTAEIPDPPRRPDASQAYAPAGAPGGRGLARYAGKYAWDKVNGRAFRDDPAVIAGMTRAGITPGLRREMGRFEVASPLALAGNILVDRACMARQCSDVNYALFVNADTGAAALCLYDSMAAGRAVRWYAIGSTITLPGQCPETAEQAPGPVKRALGVTDVVVVPTYGRGTAAYDDAPAGTAAGGGLPDITAALPFDDAAYCYSDRLRDFFFAAEEGKPARLGALGAVTIGRQKLRDGQIRQYATIAARWHGLTIVGLEHVFLPDTDASALMIAFREPASVTRPALQRLGFRFGQYSGDDAMDRSTTLSPKGSGSELECAS